MSTPVDVEGAPTPQQAAPWAVLPEWALEQPVNRWAAWGLGLGLASVLPGVGLAGVVVSVLGLRRARRTRGRGTRAAVAGLVLAVAFLLVDVAGGVALHGRSQAGVAAGPSTTGSDGGSGGAPHDLPDPSDRRDLSLSATQQRFIDDLSDVTFLNFDDTDLLKMGHEACTDFDAGRSPDTDSGRLDDRFGAGWGDAWDVQKAATKEFCPQHASLMVGKGTMSA